MKRFEKRFLSGFLVVLTLCGILCTSASARSSAYLDSYSAATVAKSDGVLAVTVDVAGVGRMTDIGASLIIIYESTDNEDFYQAARFVSSDYPEMLRHNTSSYYRDAVTYQGVIGRYYYASVYVYAANANGSDEKNYTTGIVRARA